MSIPVHNAENLGELRLLIAAGGGLSTKGAPDAISGPINWDCLRRMADWHGLTPLLTRYLAEQPQRTVPEPILVELRQSTRRAALHNLLLASELLTISRQLQSRGIEHLAYKGPLLSFHLYGSVALRVSRDLDIVVPKAKLLQACEVLTEIGFIDKSGLAGGQRAAAFRFGFEHTFSRPDGIDVDLHWRLVPSFVSPSLDERGVWERGVQAWWGGGLVPTLCPEDLFLALCLHAGQHEWMYLSMFCDLYLLLDRHRGLRWDIVRRHLGDSNTTRTVLVSLCLLRAHWKVELPEDLLQQIADDTAVQQIAMAVEREFWPATEAPVPGEASMRWILQRTTRERFIDRWRYTAGIALNPTMADYQLFKLPRPLIGLYPLLRGARLALQRTRIARLPSGIA